MPEPRFYILNDQTPVRIRDALTWAKWCKENVRESMIGHHESNGIMVRTTFTGIDLAGLSGSDRRKLPKLFEGYVWKVGDDEPMIIELYRTWKEAVEGHNRLVSMCQQNSPQASSLDCRLGAVR